MNGHTPGRPIMVLVVGGGTFGGFPWRSLFALAVLSLGLAGCGAGTQSSKRDLVGYSFVTTDLGSLLPIDLTTGAAEAPLAVPRFLFGDSSIKIAPDGRTLYATEASGQGVVPINLATGSLGHAIKVPNAEAIAITPDSRTAYVTGETDTITSINLASRRVGKPIDLPRFSPGGARRNYIGIALTPDARIAYVVDGYTDLIPVNLATGTVGTPINIPLGTGAIDITPDGRTAYVVNTTNVAQDRCCLSYITPVDLATGTVGKPISLLHAPYDIAISPNGRTAYVTTGEGSPPPPAIIPIDLSSGTAGKPIRIDGGAMTIAVAPSSHHTG
jgi:DNA-binding beta-propeller fold protein YncE